MEAEENYIEINKKTWNDKVAPHLASGFYAQQDFLAGKNSLKEIEMELLGNLHGKSVLHLQCHFGQDTISLARMGARSFGVDFSDKAIDVATETARQLNAEAHFLCYDIYELPNKLYQQFDLVFTSYGTIGWLPDLDRWAKVISHFLKPGGKFVFVEFHPVVWMFDDDFRQVAYRYFKSDPIIEASTGTYADRNSQIENKSISWNHALSEVFKSLLDAGLSVDSFAEYDYSPYDCFKGMEETEPGKFRIAHLKDYIPMVYSIVASKK